MTDTVLAAPPTAPATGSDDGLQVHGLAVDLGGRRVLTGVDLTVRPGELVGLLGPNGAGKTTLLRSVVGLQRSAAGQVTVHGRAIRPGRTPLGYVPQRHEFAWDFPISVEDVVMSGRARAIGALRRPREADWQAVGTALELVAMTGLRTRPVGQLSGGQRQRVLVARALALGSPVLLLDEPFTGLDLPTQEMLTELFRGLAAEGRAVLMTTHDLASALFSCSRLVLLNRTVVASGSPAQLSADPGAWARAFGVAETSPLLRILRAV